MPSPPKPMLFAKFTIASSIPRALNPSANIPAATTSITTPLKLFAMALKNTFSPSPSFSKLNLCLNASKTIAIIIERIMTLDMFSFIVFKQYGEKTTTKIIGKNGKRA